MYFMNACNKLEWLRLASLSSLVQISKKGKEPYIGATERCFTQVGSGLPYNCNLQTFVNYSCKLFYNLDNRSRVDVAESEPTLVRGHRW
jgi:hypothetical protein